MVLIFVPREQQKLDAGKPVDGYNRTRAVYASEGPLVHALAVSAALLFWDWTSALRIAGFLGKVEW